jgi:hypothetical protein
MATAKEFRINLSVAARDRPKGFAPYTTRILAFTPIEAVIKAVRCFADPATPLLSVKIVDAYPCCRRERRAYFDALDAAVTRRLADPAAPRVRLYDPLPYEVLPAQASGTPLGPERAKAIRKSLGLTQAQMGAALGETGSRVSRYELAHMRIPPTTATRYLDLEEE